MFIRVMKKDKRWFTIWDKRKTMENYQIVSIAIELLLPCTAVADEAVVIIEIGHILFGHL